MRKKEEMKAMLWEWGQTLEICNWKEEELQRLEMFFLTKERLWAMIHSKEEQEEARKEFEAERNNIRVEIVEKLRNKAKIDALLNRLTNDERLFVQMRFEKGYGFDYIGVKLHLSRATLFRLQNKTLEKMAALLEEE